MTFGEGAESGRSRCSLRQRVCVCVCEETLGAETKEKEARFAWVEEESHLEDSRVDRGGVEQG